MTWLPTDVQSDFIEKFLGEHETYECLCCERRFTAHRDNNGPQECPHCRHVYVKWVTWDEKRYPVR